MSAGETRIGVGGAGGRARAAGRRLALVALAWLATPLAAGPAAAGDGLDAAPRLDVAAGMARLARLPLARVVGDDGREAEVIAGVVVARRDGAAAPGPAVAAASPGVAARAPWRPGPPGDPLADVELLFLADDLPPDEAARRLAAIPGVVFAEPYYVHRLGALPDDALLGDQLNLVLAGAPAAWDLVRGGDFPATVAVVDGGVDITHRDLAANVLINDADPLNGLDDDGNGYVDDTRGWNFATGTDDPGALAATTPLSVRHGTHVAGLVSAVTDNALLVAGMTWNGPVLCVAAGDPARDDRVRFGYQGLLYAAERGARVINCSWGRSLTASLLERAVLARVEELGAVVVAAAGNDGNAFPFYPAAYPDVVAVANVTDAGDRHPTSNWGLWVDLAAPGANVLSLFPGGGTGRLTGTSMAAPLVAGAAALVLGREPWLAPAGARARLRLGARLLPAALPDGSPGLGGGLLDAGRAVAWAGAGYRLAGLDATEAQGDGDGVPEPGETVALRPRWRNELADGRGPIALRLEVRGTKGTVLTADGGFPPAAAGATVTTDAPLLLAVDPALAPGESLELIWELTGGAGEEGYRDRVVAGLSITPLYHDLDAGELRFTIAGNGRIGFAGRGGGDGADGGGVRYVAATPARAESPLGNLLFEGALLLGTAPDRLSDAARYSPLGAFRRELNPVTAQDAPRALPEIRLPDGGERLARAVATFADARAPAPLPVSVRWLALAPLDGRPAGTSLLLATVTNTGTDLLAGLRYGYFLDWDLNDGGYFPAFRTNSTTWDAAAGLAFTGMAGDPEGFTVATTLVPEGVEPVRCRAIANDGSDPGGGWGIYDGFLDEEKWEALSRDDGPHAALDTDVSQVLAAGPRDLAPGDSVRFVLVLAAGATRAAAAAHAAGGVALARRALALPVGAGPPEPFAVSAPYPNPWNGRVEVAVRGNPLAPWRLVVYDLRGRLVRRDGPRLATAAGTLAWDGRDDAGRPAPAGVYLLVVTQADQAAARPVALVR